MNSILKICAIIMLPVCFFAMACNKNAFNADGWQPQLLGPVATGTVTVEALGDIKNKYFEQDISAGNLGFTQPTLPFVPALAIGEVGPYVNQISTYFQYGEIDTASLLISFTNNFPFTVKQGTMIVLRSAADTLDANNIVVSHSIISDITPGTTYSFPMIFTNKYVPSTIYLYLQNFRTDSATNVTFGEQDSKVSFVLNVLRVNLLAINTNRACTFNDTTSIQISGSQSNSVSDSSVAGTIKLILNNRLPVNFSSQLIFLDANKNPIDSLIKGNSTVNAATTDVNGIAANPVPGTLIAPVNYALLHNLQQSKYMVYRMSANTYNLPGEIAIAGKGSGVDFQLITNLKIQMGNFIN